MILEVSGKDIRVNWASTLPSEKFTRVEKRDECRVNQNTHRLHEVVSSLLSRSRLGEV